MGRLETRELAYFLAVADELHFGRAATRLGIAQPALSKTVRQLERRLGVTRFERTSRAVALTEAGRVLNREARVAYAHAPGSPVPVIVANGPLGSGWCKTLGRDRCRQDGPRTHH